MNFTECKGKMNAFLKKIPALPGPEDLIKSHEPYRSSKHELLGEKWWDWVCCDSSPGCITTISPESRLDLRVSHNRHHENWRNQAIGKLTVQLDYVLIDPGNPQYDATRFSLIYVSLDSTNSLLQDCDEPWGMDVKGRKALYGAAKEIYGGQIEVLTKIMPRFLQDILEEPSNVDSH